MRDLRELGPAETGLAVDALRELRPQHASPEELVERVDAQRSGGYRLLASFADGEAQAAAVAGFRASESLAWGRHLYVDDLVTRAARRGEGHADRLFVWLENEARGLGCDQLHLDSGVGPERADAHRFYFRHALRITSYHFARQIG